jgi:predicted lactoylglutathione lyase
MDIFQNSFDKIKVLIMIGYTTIGSKNLDNAVSFYDALLTLIGGKRVMEMDRIKFYGTEAGGAMLAVCTPHNNEEQSCGNGQQVAIPGGSIEGAQALYSKAIELGATDAGEPGQRFDFFYGSYVYDLDGNKLCFFHMT